MNYCVTLYELRGKTWHIKDIQILWSPDLQSLRVATEALHHGPYTITPVENADGNI